MIILYIYNVSKPSEFNSNPARSWWNKSKVTLLKLELHFVCVSPRIKCRYALKNDIFKYEWVLYLLIGELFD